MATDAKIAPRWRSHLVGLCYLSAAFGLSAGCTAGEPPAELSSAVTQDPFEFIERRSPLLVGSDPVAVFNVPVVNHTAETVRFGGIMCGCACSESELPKRELGPGESMTVRLAVRVSGKSGDQLFVCRWADDQQRSWAAGVRVELFAPEEFEPSRLALGVADVGGSLTGTVVFRQCSADEDKLPSAPAFQSTDPTVDLTVEPSRVRKLPSGIFCRETPVTVRTRPGDRLGYLCASLSAGKSSNASRLLIEWASKAAVTTSPARVTLVHGGISRQRVRITTTDSLPLKLNSVFSGTSAIKAVAVEDSDGCAAVDVQIADGDLSGTVRSELRIETTHPRAAVISIPLTVLVVPKPKEAD